MSKKNRLVIIVGSVREGRFGPVVASWVADQASTHGGFDVEVVDLADFDIPLSHLPRRRSTPATRTRVRRACRP